MWFLLHFISIFKKSLFDKEEEEEEEEKTTTTTKRRNTDLKTFSGHPHLLPFWRRLTICHNLRRKEELDQTYKE